MNEAELTLARLNPIYEQLGDREPSTVTDAEAVIENIRLEKGHLSEEFLEDIQSLQERHRLYIERTFEEKRSTEARYTKDISEQLYSSKYRFLYELIQNADDSDYTIARSRGDVPKLNFQINREQIIVDTNEDGFTRANVEAICATGRSSKKRSSRDNHIGEKGFGFKAVFSVAHTVHIQSGFWSFSFKHRRGDDGLGMVTPLTTEHAELPVDVTTRITLTLSDITYRGFFRLQEAVKEFPMSTIFFLQRLENIGITTLLLDLQEVIVNIQKKPGSTSRDVNIGQQVTIFNESGTLVSDRTDIYAYRVFSRKYDMPEDDARRGRTSARVELAFPYDAATGQPKLSERGQHVFAYLPLQRLPQVQFLIQSDFITSANRESVIECDWNDAIRDGIANLFFRAVLEFATPDHPLRYSWLDFLPTKPMEGIWKTLYAQIKAPLRESPILQAWESRSFQVPSELRRVVQKCLHENRPIFPDLPSNIYLAPEYDTNHNGVLEELGCEYIHWTDVLDLLRADLVNIESRLRTTEPSSPWHEQCSRLLLSIFQSNDLVKYQDQVRRLAIIPLVGGKLWTGAPGVGPGAQPNIYFPSTDGITIPLDISLQLVDPRAVKYESRKELFKIMGVEDCAPEIVMEKIQQAHERRVNQLSLRNIRSHFRYLFNFHRSPTTIKDWINVPMERDTMKLLPLGLYLPSTEPYHTQQLLEKSDYCLISESVVSLEAPGTCQNGQSWIDWLQIATGARFFPALSTDQNSPRKLSPLILSVLESNPEKFLGLLQAHWVSEYKSMVEENSGIRNGLANCIVLCELGMNAKLSSTFLPHEITRDEIRRFNVQQEFPLLYLPVTLDNSNRRDWEFLEVFGVRIHPELDLDCYFIILEKKILEMSAANLEEITQIYMAIAGIIQAPQRDRTKEFFQNKKAIYGMKSGSLEWVSPNDCVWEGPDFIVYNKPLHHIYGQRVHLEQFFTEVLGIRNASIKEALDQLMHHSVEGTGTQSEAARIYKHLKDTIYLGRGHSWETIRQWFSEYPLILAYGRWHKLPSCLWKSPCPLSDYAELSSQYPELRDFFVGRLKVQSATPKMLVENLIKMTNENNPNANEIIGQLLSLGMIAKNGGLDREFCDSIDRLRVINFLPKRTAIGHDLVGIKDRFVISDLQRFGLAFANHNILLDFTPEQTSILDPIFKRLGLTHRYLTNAVEEVSKVGEDAEESTSLSKLLQRKAYALYCCAAKFKSSRALINDPTLFDHLSKLRVCTTDEFSTELILKIEDHDPIIEQSGRVLQVHCEDKDSEIVLYLPRDQQKAKRCYRNHLPGLLCRIMESDGAGHQVSRVLDTEFADLDELLSELDIAEVSWISKPTLDPETPDISQTSELEIFNDNETYVVSPSPNTRENSVIHESPAIRASPTARENLEIGESSVIRESSLLREYSVVNAVNWRSNTSNARTVSVEPPPPSTERFAELLDQIKRFAQWSVYEDEGEARPHVQHFDHVETFGDYELHRAFHNNRIGAAGELYVYEVLSELDLPNFTLNNWQSGIRGQVSVHQDYQNLTNTREVEGADIVYIDESGQFRTWLREKCEQSYPEDGHDDSSRGGVKYLIEVKTTPTYFRNTFYMTHEQYRLMERHQVRGNDPDTVYVLMRVYNLSNENIGMKIYVDPWRFRDNVLHFHTNRWDVTPA